MLAFVSFSYPSGSLQFICRHCSSQQPSTGARASDDSEDGSSSSFDTDTDSSSLSDFESDSDSDPVPAKDEVKLEETARKWNEEFQSLCEPVLGDDPEVVLQQNYAIYKLFLCAIPL